MVGTTLVEQTATSLEAAFTNLWASFLNVFPGLVAAVFILAAGGIVGVVAGRVLTRILKEARLDFWIEKHGLGKALSGMQMSVVFGSILKWYIIVVFLGESANAIRLDLLRGFLEALVKYVPLLIGAFLVFIFGMLIGEYAKNSILKKIEFRYKNQLAGVAKFLVVYFAVVIALQTAGFRVDILIDAFRIGFTAVVLIIAILVGLTFAYAVGRDAKQFWKSVISR